MKGFSGQGAMVMALGVDELRHFTATGVSLKALYGE